MGSGSSTCAGLFARLRQHDHGDGLQLLGEVQQQQGRAGHRSGTPDIVKKTYDYMYDQAYNGNRAPVLIANHFSTSGTAIPSTRLPWIS